MLTCDWWVVLPDDELVAAAAGFSRCHGHSLRWLFVAKAAHFTDVSGVYCKHSAVKATSTVSSCIDSFDV